jgi:hypothetical protein
VSSTGPLAVNRIIKAKQESRKTINRVRGKEENRWIKKIGADRNWRTRKSLQQKMRWMKSNERKEEHKQCSVEWHE